MKATELQLGDYVNYRGQIIKVTSLYDKGGSNEVGWSDKESVWVNGRCIEPIPLTREILEKNGFEDYDSYATLDTEKYRVIYAFDGFLTIVDDDNQRKVSYLECDYVHHLQHTLRLCRIEKEIEL